MMAGSGRSSAWPHDAARRNAGQLVRPLEFAGERIAVWAARAALDVTIMLLPGAANREMPRGIVGHRTLDAEQASVEIGDDQEEGVGEGRGRGRSWPLLVIFTDIFGSPSSIYLAGLDR